MTTTFSEFEYARPDLDKLRNEVTTLIDVFKKTGTADGQVKIYKEIMQIMENFRTMQTISRIRYTINTEDEFYDTEHNFFDDHRPVVMRLEKSFREALNSSEFRNELVQELGEVVFKKSALLLRTFSEEIAEDLVHESHLVNKYVKLIASAKISFEGEDRNIAGMDPFMQSTDRELRKKASEAKWKFFADNEAEFDNIYDGLVKLRTSMARKLGYDNFVDMGYDRMNRMGYGPAEVKAFRDNVKEYLVPIANTLHEMRMKRLGLDKLYYYDASLDYPDGNPDPKGDPEWIVENAKNMYRELSDETGEFIDFMTERSLMDLHNKPGKSAGGYCSFIPAHKSPFIFANMNGTSHDVRVLTHEAGHAFQAFVCRNMEIPDHRHATMEACEVHSMGMEFLTWPWMKLFFEEDTEKFLLHHLSRAIKFIPYGVSIDEFQHYVYENPDASPADRKAMWREIEKKYQPKLDYADNDFLSRGGFWFHQQHVFRMPFYYIDYCLAQVCALQLWRKSNTDRENSWENYLAMCKAGGTKPFLELLNIAKIDSPFERATLAQIVSYAEGWIEDDVRVVENKLA